MDVCLVDRVVVVVEVDGVAMDDFKVDCGFELEVLEDEEDEDILDVDVDVDVDILEVEGDVFVGRRVAKCRVCMIDRTETDKLRG